MVLTERGRHFVEYPSQVQGKQDPACPTCQDRRAVITRDLAGIAQKLEQAFRSPLAVGVTLDQAYCRAEASICRTLALYAHGALEDKNVLLLGDDDLVSLAIGFLGQALDIHLARRIVVVETDPAWLDLIRATSDRQSLGIECVRHDLRDPLPEGLRGQFDTFETDPPDTTAGMALFVSRAIQALRPGAGQQGLLSFEHKSPAELLDVQSHLVRMELAAHEVVPVSNEHRGASTLGGSSQMIYLLTTPTTHALVPEVPYEGAIYAGEASLTVRFYVCTRCKARYRVGQQHSFVTIESLKVAGCTNCGHTRFRHVQRIAVQPNRLPSLAGKTAAENARRTWTVPPIVGDWVQARGVQLDGA